MVAIKTKELVKLLITNAKEGKLEPRLVNTLTVILESLEPL